MDSDVFEIGTERDFRIVSEKEATRFLPASGTLSGKEPFRTGRALPVEREIDYDVHSWHHFDGLRSFLRPGFGTDAPKGRCPGPRGTETPPPVRTPASDRLIRLF